MAKSDFWLSIYSVLLRLNHSIACVRMRKIATKIATKIARVNGPLYNQRLEQRYWPLFTLRGARESPWKNYACATPGNLPIFFFPCFLYIFHYILPFDEHEHAVVTCLKYDSLSKVSLIILIKIAEKKSLEQLNRVSLSILGFLNDSSFSFSINHAFIIIRNFL